MAEIYEGTYVIPRETLGLADEFILVKNLNLWFCGSPISTNEPGPFGVPKVRIMLKGGAAEHEMFNKEIARNF